MRYEMNSRLLKLCNFVLFGLMSASIFATTFIETPVSSRLEVATGVIRGNFIGSTYKKNPMGRVVTEATFQVTQASGIEPHQMINRNTFKVSFPGGEWNGMTYKVSGTPQFKKGEDVVLMVTKGKFGFILPDLTLSKFSVYKKEGSEVLVSSIFSEKNGVGKITLTEFNELANHRFGTPLVSFNSDTHIHIAQNKKHVAATSIINDYKARDTRARTPSSIQDEADDSIPIIWFVLALGLLGFLSNFLLRGRRE